MAGPYVVSAFLCERVLEDQDGVFSFIRVVNELRPEAHIEFALQPLSHDPGAPPAEQVAMSISRLPMVNLVVTISAGGEEGLGTHTMVVAVIAPSGDRAAAFQGEVVLTDAMMTGVLVLSLDLNERHGQMLRVPEFGDYWIDVTLGDRLLSRGPLRVAPNAPDEPASESSQSSG